MANICQQCRMHIQPHQPIARDEFRKTTTPESTLAEVLLVIGDEECTVERYDSEILRVKGILEKLEEEKRALEVQIQQRRSYVSSLRRVSQELWVEIFSICLAEHPSTEIPYGADRELELNWRRRFEMPFRLSQVCSRWRDVATSTPSLWSTIFLNLHCGDRKRALELHFKRSRGVSLDVNLCALRAGTRRNAKVEEQRKSDAEQTFQVLIHHMARIRSLLMLKLGSEFQFAGVRPHTVTTEATFSCLESLCMGDSKYPVWFVEAVQNQAPRLTELILEDFEAGDAQFQMIAGNTSLKSLKLQGLTTCARLIELIPTLRHLESLVTSHRILSVDDPVHTTGRSDSLLHLTVPILSVYSPMLRSLELPNLQTLTLGVSGEDIRVDDLADALARFSSLESISLTRVSAAFVGSGRLANLLRGLPAVASFKMQLGLLQYGGRANTASLTKTISSFYSDLADIPTISPRLESLELILRGMDIAEETLDELVRMLETRAGTGDGDGLKNVYLEAEGCTARGKRKTEVIDRLRDVEAIGVKCVVKHYKNHKPVFFFP
ncbi:hypothetical protein AAF712_009120 [Marasmius tenuissimus]|uniref:F-box domain-containing protein n=1 Tax=Marasmius tenuissimus TaxID=585030 RepID=A0ABR2ZQH9_9AGAR